MIKIGKYRGLRVQAPDIRVTERALTHALKNLQAANSVIIHIDARPAENGDRAVLDMHASIDGQPLPGMRRSHYALILGNGSFLPGFDEKIIGHSAGDHFHFQLTLPEMVPSEFTADSSKLKMYAGRTIDFTIRILSLGVQELPPLDDSFAKDFSEYETLPELREALYASLEEKKAEREDARIRRELLTQIIAQSKLHLDKEILRDLEEAEYEKFEEKLAEQSLSPEEFIERTGKSMNEIQKDCCRRAERTLAETTVLSQIAKKERLSLSEEELTDALYDLADYYEMEFEEFLDSMDEEETAGIELELICEKAMQLVLDEAVYI